MNPFVEHLPWRVGAVAGLIVGAVCVFAGVDLWVSLLRVGAAFAVFGLGGLALRAILRQGEAESKTPGVHVDQTTPPMSIEDVTRPASSPGRRGDESDK